MWGGRRNSKFTLIFFPCNELLENYIRQFSGTRRIANECVLGWVKGVWSRGTGLFNIFIIFHENAFFIRRRNERKKCKNKIFTAINFNRRRRKREEKNSRNIYFTISQELKWNFSSIPSHFSFIATAIVQRFILNDISIKHFPSLRAKELWMRNSKTFLTARWSENSKKETS